MSVAQLAGSRRPKHLVRLAGHRWLFLFSLAVCVLAVVVAVLAPLIAPHDPYAVDLAAAYQRPSAAHWLGTDESGRDILSRLLVGTRSTLLGPACVLLISMSVGTLVALLAGWRGGWVDTVVSRVLDIVFAFPGLILALLLATLFGTGFLTPVLALSIAYAAVVARVIRTAVIRERNLPYIAALEVHAVSTWRICFRHIVPNVMPLILVQSAVWFAYALLDLAAISYLGLGLQPPTPNWGVMAADGQASIDAGFPEQSIFAAMAILLVVVAVNVVGEKMATYYEIDRVE